MRKPRPAAPRIPSIAARILCCSVSRPSDCQPGACAYVLLVDDELFRDQPFAATMSLSGVERTQLIVGRAIKTPWYYQLTGYVNKLNGDMGVIGPSPRGEYREMPAKRRRKKRQQGVKGPPDLRPDGKCGECEHLDRVSFVNGVLSLFSFTATYDADTKSFEFTSINLQTGREPASSAQRGPEGNATQGHT